VTFAKRESSNFLYYSEPKFQTWLCGIVYYLSKIISKNWYHMLHRFFSIFFQANRVIQKSSQSFWLLWWVFYLRASSVDTSKSQRERYFPEGFGMNLDFGAPTCILNLKVPFCARPRRFISCHFAALCQRNPFSLYNHVSAHNKCNFKYTMKSTTKMQVLELRPVKCGSFCIRKKRNLR
jgi:hypothetical protein